MKIGTLIIGLILAGDASAAVLSSDSKTITTKARSIERDYSRSMRTEREEHQMATQPPIEVIREEPGLAEDEMLAPQPTFYQEPQGTEYISYSSTLKMREDLKVGVGAVLGGQLGQMGVNLEFNFEDINGVIAGFGRGPGYNSVQLAWKHSFEGDYLAPYTTAGYSRWYNSAGGGHEYTKSDILDRVLTDSEKREGRFGTDFLFGSAGIQYNQLSGPLSGFSVYAELIVLAEMKRSMLLPTGAVGTTYYF